MYSKKLVAMLKQLNNKSNERIVLAIKIIVFAFIVITLTILLGYLGAFYFLAPIY